MLYEGKTILLASFSGILCLSDGELRLDAAVQELSPLIELAEVHVAEAKVVEEIGVIGILAEEFHTMITDVGSIRRRFDS